MPTRLPRHSIPVTRSLPAPPWDQFRREGSLAGRLYMQDIQGVGEHDTSRDYTIPYSLISFPLVHQLRNTNNSPIVFNMADQLVRDDAFLLMRSSIISKVMERC
jgi:hypothetical protein